MGMPHIGMSNIGISRWANKYIRTSDMWMPDLGISYNGMSDIEMSDIGLSNIGISDMGRHHIGISDTRIGISDIMI